MLKKLKGLVFQKSGQVDWLTKNESNLNVYTNMQEPLKFRLKLLVLTIALEDSTKMFKLWMLGVLSYFLHYLYCALWASDEWKIKFCFPSAKYDN